MEPIWNYIKNCKKSLFRFEGLQDYSTEDGDELVKFFIETGVLKEHPNDSDEWWKDIKDKNKRGIITQRVRLVKKPLTDYTKMELVYLKEARKYSGDDIRAIEENDFEKIAPNGLKDFYIIDDQYVFEMEYGLKGKYLKSKMISNDKVDKYLDLKKKLFEYAKSF